MIALPNPFQTTANEGRSQEAPAAVTLNPHETAGALVEHLLDQPVTPFESRFILDVDAFMNDIEPLPAFLVDPSPEYLRANDLMPVLAVLAGH